MKAIVFGDREVLISLIIIYSRCYAWVLWGEASLIRSLLDCYITPEKFENAAIFIQLGQPSTLIR